MPTDPANPQTLIIEGDIDHLVEISRIDNMIYIHTNGRLISPMCATIGLDEEMATMICDGLNAILLKQYSRVVSRAMHRLEKTRAARRADPTPSIPATPRLEDL